MHGVLTLLDAADNVLEEVDRDALRPRKVCFGVDGQELVHLVLRAELRGELCCGDTPLLLRVDLHGETEIKMIASVTRLILATSDHETPSTD